MTRPKMEKGERGNKAELLISVEEFMKTRDNVVTSLTTLQGAIGDLLRAYLSHTTAVLGGTSNTSAELNAVTANILTNARQGALDEQFYPALPNITGATPTATDIKLTQKKKQRRKKDPNAPKAPPTAYFLFASSARNTVKSDLGDDAKGNAVTEETSRRWNAMPDEDKEKWKDLYKKNFVDYKARLATYNSEKAVAGEEVVEPEDESAEAVSGVDALQAAAAAQASDNDSEDTDSSSSDSSDSESEEEEKPPTPVPEVKKRSKKSNSKPTPSVAAPSPAVKSPERKRKEAPREETSEPPKKKKNNSKSSSTKPVERTPEPAPSHSKDKKRKNRSRN